jgi:hypothetical protein
LKIIVRLRRIVVNDNERYRWVATWKCSQQQSIVLGFTTRPIVSSVGIERPTLKVPVWSEEESPLKADTPLDGVSEASGSSLA